jgi:hypothetical protein
MERKILAVRESHEAVEREGFIGDLLLAQFLMEEKRLLSQPCGVTGDRLRRHFESGGELAIARAAHEAARHLEENVGSSEPVGRTKRPVAERPLALEAEVALDRASVNSG